MADIVKILLGMAELVVVVYIIAVNRRFPDYLRRRDQRYHELRDQGKSFDEAARIVDTTVYLWSKSNDLDQS